MACFKERINLLFEEAKNKDYRITQVQYASKFGASRAQLQGWMIGAGEPDSEMMKKIAEISHTSVDWLVGASDLRRPYVVESESEEYNKILDKIGKDDGINIGDLKTIKFKNISNINYETLIELIALTDKIKKEIAGN